MTRLHEQKLGMQSKERTHGNHRGARNACMLMPLMCGMLSHKHTTIKLASDTLWC